MCNGALMSLPLPCQTLSLSYPPLNPFPSPHITLSRRDEHPTGMMCNGALMSRPLSALKDALAAVLLFLGGVLPPHIAYSPGQQHVAHDWLWSVGAHPLSATSTGEGGGGGGGRGRGGNGGGVDGRVG